MSNLKDVLIKNLEFMQEEGMNLSQEIKDIRESDGQILGVLIQIAKKIGFRPDELLNPTFKSLHDCRLKSGPPPTCS